MTVASAALRGVLAGTIVALAGLFTARVVVDALISGPRGFLDALMTLVLVPPVAFFVGAACAFLLELPLAGLISFFAPITTFLLLISLPSNVFLQFGVTVVVYFGAATVAAALRLFWPEEDDRYYDDHRRGRAGARPPEPPPYPRW